MSLATAEDVAAALGLDDSSDLTDSQERRLEMELARVERAFLREAERDFVSGPVRVQCTVVGGWVTLPDSPADDTAPTVEDREGNELSAMVSDGARLKVGRNNWALPSGLIVNVSYTAPDPPVAVRAAIASIVGRRLSVEPGSTESKFTDLSAGDYRAKGAAWVSSTAILTDDEKAEARSYRPVSGTVIIARWDDERHRWIDDYWDWDWRLWPGRW